MLPPISSRRMARSGILTVRLFISISLSPCKRPRFREINSRTVPRRTASWRAHEAKAVGNTDHAAHENQGLNRRPNESCGLLTGILFYGKVVKRRRGEVFTVGARCDAPGRRNAGQTATGPRWRPL